MDAETLFEKIMDVGDGCTCDACRETITIMLNAALGAEREACAALAGEYDSLAEQAIRYGRS